MGLDAAVLSLTRAQVAFALTGPEPQTGNGAPLRPGVDQGADQAYWLDRMLRSSHPLVERMALIFHDWFATDADIVQHWDLTFAQTNVFREHALGSFHDLVVAITRDPAMMLFLDLNRNRKGEVNENYARELMELFTLGADRGAYTEQDVREVARALTGWTAPWRPETGFSGFYFDPGRHDAGSKTIFGQTGALQLARRLPADRGEPPPRELLRREAVELLHPDAAERRGAGRARRTRTWLPAIRSSRSSRRSSRRAPSTRARRW